VTNIIGIFVAFLYFSMLQAVQFVQYTIRHKQYSPQTTTHCAVHNYTQAVLTTNHEYYIW